MADVINDTNPEVSIDPELRDDTASRQQPGSEPPHRPGRRLPHWLSIRTARGVLIASLVLMGVCLIVFFRAYSKFARITDEKLRTGVFADTLNIFAEPRYVTVGDRLSLNDAVLELQENGYTTATNNRIGWYNVRQGAVAIFPGTETGSDQEPAVIHFSRNKVSRIVSLADNTERRAYRYAPQLITNLSDRNREKRRLVHFSEIPPALVHAVVAVEDKRFFSHGGFDLFRIVKAAYVDLKDGRKEQGASTLSMQLARGLWLEPDKNWKRKAEELLITLHLEHKLSKQQIFEYYANEVYMGRHGTFSINGFGEAARTYFGKDISRLDAAEAALLAGMIQRPSYYNPFRYPDRALERRNLVLHLMRENGFLTADDCSRALAEPVRTTPGDLESLDSQYFLDLVNDELQSRLGEHDPQSEYVFTTLDLDLQRAAVEAVRKGMQSVDEQLRKRKRREPIPPGQPQAALVALDPHTGEIKALVGGRDYTSSQLNHATAERQPGSSFKPFVYAAALNTALGEGSTVLTPATTVEDEPTEFTFGTQTYKPGNFEQNYMGTVTLREALAHSLNVAAVKVAEMVGYGKVVDLARQAGLNDGIQPTPAVALGAYDATPLEIAGAYTIFANGGTFIQPTLLSTVRSRQGRALFENKPETRRVLDPRVAYLMVNMLEEVMRSGTGAGARSRGFRVPAAGKTGTSRDGWFAGFTSELLCVVWVGFDDNRELKLEGAKSALPIWTDFMKKALRYRAYRDAREFPVPSGVVSAKLCSDSRELATPQCPSTYTEFFIDGSQPVAECPLHSGVPSNWQGAASSDWISGRSFELLPSEPPPRNPPPQP